MKLIILDTHSHEKNIFDGTLQNDVLLITYNSEKHNTATLFYKTISEQLPSNQLFTSIGWGFHGYFEEINSLKYSFSILKNKNHKIFFNCIENKKEECLVDVKNSSSDVLILKNILKPLLVENGRIDMFMCNLFKEPLKTYFLFLEDTCKVNLAASSNITGNTLVNVGKIEIDWILESEIKPINLKSIYFNDKIDKVEIDFAFPILMAIFIASLAPYVYLAAAVVASLFEDKWLMELHRNSEKLSYEPLNEKWTKLEQYYWSQNTSHFWFKPDNFEVTEWEEKLYNNGINSMKTIIPPNTDMAKGMALAGGKVGVAAGLAVAGLQNLWWSEKDEIKYNKSFVNSTAGIVSGAGKMGVPRDPPHLCIAVKNNINYLKIIDKPPVPNDIVPKYSDIPACRDWLKCNIAIETSESGFEDTDDINIHTFTVLNKCESSYQLAYDNSYKNERDRRMWVAVRNNAARALVDTMSSPEFEVLSVIGDLTGFGKAFVPAKLLAKEVAETAVKKAIIKNMATQLATKAIRKKAKKTAVKAGVAGVAKPGKFARIVGAVTAGPKFVFKSVAKGAKKVSYYFSSERKIVAKLSVAQRAKRKEAQNIMNASMKEIQEQMANDIKKLGMRGAIEKNQEYAAKELAEYHSKQTFKRKALNFLEGYRGIPFASATNGGYSQKLLKEAQEAYLKKGSKENLEKLMKAQKDHLIMKQAPILPGSHLNKMKVMKVRQEALFKPLRSLTRWEEEGYINSTTPGYGSFRNAITFRDVWKRIGGMAIAEGKEEINSLAGPEISLNIGGYNLSMPTESVVGMLDSMNPINRKGKKARNALFLLNALGSLGFDNTMTMHMTDIFSTEELDQQIKAIKNWVDSIPLDAGIPMSDINKEAMVDYFIKKQEGSISTINEQQSDLYVKTNLTMTGSDHENNIVSFESNSDIKTGVKLLYEKSEDVNTLSDDLQVIDEVFGFIVDSTDDELKMKLYKENTFENLINISTETGTTHTFTINHDINKTIILFTNSQVHDLNDYSSYIEFEGTSSAAFLETGNSIRYYSNDRAPAKNIRSSEKVFIRRQNITNASGTVVIRIFLYKSISNLLKNKMIRLSNFDDDSVSVFHQLHLSNNKKLNSENIIIYSNNGIVYEDDREDDNKINIYAKNAILKVNTENAQITIVDGGSGFRTGNVIEIPASKTNGIDKFKIVVQDVKNKKSWKYNHVLDEFDVHYLKKDDNYTHLRGCSARGDYTKFGVEGFRKIETDDGKMRNDAEWYAKTQGFGEFISPFPVQRKHYMSWDDIKNHQFSDIPNVYWYSNDPISMGIDESRLTSFDNFGSTIEVDNDKNNLDYKIAKIRGFNMLEKINELTVTGETQHDYLDDMYTSGTFMWDDESHDILPMNATEYKHITDGDISQIDTSVDTEYRHTNIPCELKNAIFIQGPALTQTGTEFTLSTPDVCDATKVYLIIGTNIGQSASGTPYQGKENPEDHNNYIDTTLRDSLIHDGWEVSSLNFKSYNDKFREKSMGNFQLEEWVMVLIVLVIAALVAGTYVLSAMAGPLGLFLFGLLVSGGGISGIIALQEHLADDIYFTVGDYIAYEKIIYKSEHEHTLEFSIPSPGQNKKCGFINMTIAMKGLRTFYKEFFTNSINTITYRPLTKENKMYSAFSREFHIWIKDGVSEDEIIKNLEVINIIVKKKYLNLIPILRKDVIKNENAKQFIVFLKGYDVFELDLFIKNSLDLEKNDFDSEKVISCIGESNLTPKEEEKIKSISANTKWFYVHQLMNINKLQFQNGGDLITPVNLGAKDMFGHISGRGKCSHWICNIPISSSSSSASGSNHVLNLNSSGVSVRVKMHYFYRDDDMFWFSKKPWTEDSYTIAYNGWSRYYSDILRLEFTEENGMEKLNTFNKFKNTFEIKTNSTTPEYSRTYHGDRAESDLFNKVNIPSSTKTELDLKVNDIVTITPNSEKIYKIITKTSTTLDMKKGSKVYQGGNVTISNTNRKSMQNIEVEGELYIDFLSSSSNVNNVFYVKATNNDEFLESNRWITVHPDLKFIPSNTDTYKHTSDNTLSAPFNKCNDFDYMNISQYDDSIGPEEADCLAHNQFIQFEIESIEEFTKEQSKVLEITEDSDEIIIQAIDFPLINFNLRKENKVEIEKWVESTNAIKDTYKSEYVMNDGDVIRPQIYQMVKVKEGGSEGTFDDDYKFLNFKLESKDWTRMEIYQEFNNGEENTFTVFHDPAFDASVSGVSEVLEIYNTLKTKDNHEDLLMLKFTEPEEGMENFETYFTNAFNNKERGFSSVYIKGEYKLTTSNNVTQILITNLDQNQQFNSLQNLTNDLLWGKKITFFDGDNIQFKSIVQSIDISSDSGILELYDSHNLITSGTFEILLDTFKTTFRMNSTLRFRKFYEKNTICLEVLNDFDSIWNIKGKPFSSSIFTDEIMENSIQPDIRKKGYYSLGDDVYQVDENNNITAYGIISKKYLYKEQKLYVDVTEGEFDVTKDIHIASEYFNNNFKTFDVYQSSQDISAWEGCVSDSKDTRTPHEIPLPFGYTKAMWYYLMKGRNMIQYSNTGDASIFEAINLNTTNTENNSQRVQFSGLFFGGRSFTEYEYEKFDMKPTRNLLYSSPHAFFPEDVKTALNSEYNLDSLNTQISIENNPGAVDKIQNITSYDKILFSSIENNIEWDSNVFSEVHDSRLSINEDHEYGFKFRIKQIDGASEGLKNTFGIYKMVSEIGEDSQELTEEFYPFFDKNKQTQSIEKYHPKHHLDEVNRLKRRFLWRLGVKTNVDGTEYEVGEYGFKFRTKQVEHTEIPNPVTYLNASGIEILREIKTKHDIDNSSSLQQKYKSLTSESSTVTSSVVSTKATKISREPIKCSKSINITGIKSILNTNSGINGDDDTNNNYFHVIVPNLSSQHDFEKSRDGFILAGTGLSTNSERTNTNTDEKYDYTNCCLKYDSFGSTMIVDVFQINPETQEITARGTLNNFTNNTLPSVSNDTSDTTTRYLKKCRGVLQGIEREILSIQSKIDYYVKEKNDILRKKSSINPLDDSDNRIAKLTSQINSLQEELNTFTPQKDALNLQILDVTNYRNNQFKFKRINQYLFWVKEAFNRFRNIIHGTNGDYPYREDNLLYKDRNNNIKAHLDSITDDNLNNKSQLHILEALFSDSHFLPVWIEEFLELLMKEEHSNSITDYIGIDVTHGSFKVGEPLYAFMNIEAINEIPDSLLSNKKPIMKFIGSITSIDSSTEHNYSLLSNKFSMGILSDPITLFENPESYPSLSIDFENTSTFINNNIGRDPPYEEHYDNDGNWSIMEGKQNIYQVETGIVLNLIPFNCFSNWTKMELYWYKYDSNAKGFSELHTPEIFWDFMQTTSNTIQNKIIDDIGKLEKNGMISTTNPILENLSELEKEDYIQGIWNSLFYYYNRTNHITENTDIEFGVFYKYVNDSELNHNIDNFKGNNNLNKIRNAGRCIVIRRIGEQWDNFPSDEAFPLEEGGITGTYQQRGRWSDIQHSVFFSTRTDNDSYTIHETFNKRTRKEYSGRAYYYNYEREDGDTETKVCIVSPRQDSDGIFDLGGATAFNSVEKVDICIQAIPHNNDDFNNTNITTIKLSDLVLPPAVYGLTSFEGTDTLPVGSEFHENNIYKQVPNITCSLEKALPNLYIHPLLKSNSDLRNKLDKILNLYFNINIHSTISIDDAIFNYVNDDNKKIAKYTDETKLETTNYASEWVYGTAINYDKIILAETGHNVNNPYENVSGATAADMFFEDVSDPNRDVANVNATRPHKKLLVDHTTLITYTPEVNGTVATINDVSDEDSAKYEPNDDVMYKSGEVSLHISGTLSGNTLSNISSSESLFEIGERIWGQNNDDDDVVELGTLASVVASVNGTTYNLSDTINGTDNTTYTLYKESYKYYGKVKSNFNNNIEIENVSVTGEVDLYKLTQRNQYNLVQLLKYVEYTIGHAINESGTHISSSKKWDSSLNEIIGNTTKDLVTSLKSYIVDLLNANYNIQILKLINKYSHKYPQSKVFAYNSEVMEKYKSNGVVVPFSFGTKLESNIQLKITEYDGNVSNESEVPLGVNIIDSNNEFLVASEYLQSESDNIFVRLYQSGKDEETIDTKVIGHIKSVSESEVVLELENSENSKSLFVHNMIYLESVSNTPLKGTITQNENNELTISTDTNLSNTNLSNTVYTQLSTITRLVMVNMFEMEVDSDNIPSLYSNIFKDDGTFIGKLIGVKEMIRNANTSKSTIFCRLNINVDTALIGQPVKTGTWNIYVKTHETSFNYINNYFTSSNAKKYIDANISGSNTNKLNELYNQFYEFIDFGATIMSVSDFDATHKRLLIDERKMDPNLSGTNASGYNVFLYEPHSGTFHKYGEVVDSDWSDMIKVRTVSAAGTKFYHREPNNLEHIYFHKGDDGSSIRNSITLPTSDSKFDNINLYLLKDDLNKLFLQTEKIDSNGDTEISDILPVGYIDTVKEIDVNNNIVDASPFAFDIIESSNYDTLFTMILYNKGIANINPDTVTIEDKYLSESYGGQDWEFQYAHFEECPPGQFGSPGKCQDCPAGYVTDSLSSGGATKCTPCIAGKYGINSTQLCIACESGRYSVAASNSVAECLCTSGKYSTGGNCQDCPEGSYRDFYESQGNDDEPCIGCAIGKYSNVSGATSEEACIDCEPGKFSETARSTENCSPCNAGKYQNSTGQTECISTPDDHYSGSGASEATPCPPGKITTGPRTSVSDCTEHICSGGQYYNNGNCVDTCTNDTGAISANPPYNICRQCESGYRITDNICTICPIGTYEEARSCTSCYEGTYQNQEGQTSCKLCEKGTYQDQTGLDNCSPCDAGKSSSEEAKSVDDCTDCAAGTYSTAGSECTDCVAGQYQDETGRDECKDCVAGQYQNASGQDSCTPCSLGKWSVAGESSCTACEAGKYRNINQQNGCQPCGVNKHQSEPGSTYCEDCDAGKWSNNGSVICTNCPDGKNRSSAQIPCTDCVPGTWSVAGDSSCTACVAGHYRDTQQNGCQLCEPDTYQNASGQASCKDCALGKYNLGYGSRQATECLDEKNCVSLTVENSNINNAFGTTSESIYVSCDSGYEGGGDWTCYPVTQQFIGIECTPIQCSGNIPNSNYETQILSVSYISNVNVDCNPGYEGGAGWSCNTDGEFAGTACSPCNAGKYSAVSGSACTNCEAGKYQDASGQTSCKDCDAGKHRVDVGATSVDECTDCGAGTYSINGSSDCSLCNAGQYQDSNSRDSCKDCVAGQYQDETGRDECKDCVAGQYQNASGQASCKDCVAGQYQNETGRDECKDCEKGTYQSQPGQSSCSDCDHQEWTLSGQSSCSGCPDGWYRSNLSSAYYTSVDNACLQCFNGKYQVEERCEECEAGKYQNNMGQTSCINCVAGKYSPTTSSETCTVCAAGSWSPENSTSCETCEGNTYFIESRGCYNCPAGQYRNPLTVDLNCQDCEAGKYRPSGERRLYQGIPYLKKHIDHIQFLSQGTAGQCMVNGELDGTFTNRVDCEDNNNRCVGGDEGCWVLGVGLEISVAQNLCESGGIFGSVAGCQWNAGSSIWLDLWETLDENNDDCFSCPDGKFGNQTAASSVHDCTACDAGTYEESNVCEDCDAGQYSGASASECIPCDAGKYEESNVCEDCDAGQYSGASASGCTACDGGKYLDDAETGDESIACQDCDSGEWSTASASRCTACAAGKYEESNVCEDCDAGQYSAVSGETSCIDCDAGQYSAASANSCTDCSAGQYSAASASACTACDAGKYEESNVCEDCQSGKYSGASATNCSGCAAGKYLTDKTKPTLNTACTDCDPGQYSEASASECIPCDAGQYRYEGYRPSWEGPCTLCPAGKYSGASATNCSGCTAGKYLDDAETGDESIACQDCGSGEWSTASASGCTACDAGKFRNSYTGTWGDTEPEACTLCPAGQHQSASGQTNCIPCDVNTYQNNSGQTSCISCPTGKQTFGISGVNTLGRCRGCAVGKYRVTSYYFWGVTKPYPDTVNICNPCAAGQYSGVDGDTCEGCPAGQYQNLTGMDVCKNCDTGQYQNLTSQSSCKYCEAGKYQNSEGEPLCGFCPNSQYQPNTGSTSCLHCPSGQVNYGTGNTASSDCFTPSNKTGSDTNTNKEMESNLPIADIGQYCGDWANNGECDRNPNYMLNYCATSCAAVGATGYATV